MKVGLEEVHELYWSLAHKIGGGGHTRPSEVIFEDLRRIVEAAPWQLMVLGSPGTGKGKMVQRLAEQLGIIHVTKHFLLQSFPQHELVAKARVMMEAGGGMKAIPEELLTELLKMRLKQDDCRTRGERICT